MAVYELKLSKNSKYCEKTIKTIAWERLERSRLESLGMPTRFSRHFNYSTNQPFCAKSTSFVLPPVSSTIDVALRMCEIEEYTTRLEGENNTKGGGKGNSLGPFYTRGKPTCGYFFSLGTDNKKRLTGIPPSNLVAWRTTWCSELHPAH